MEFRDLYDINRNLTGATIAKGDPIPKGNYILVVLVFIQNSKGEFLIQKRSEAKNGKYGSTGGHAKTGESSLEGIITETSEELGLVVNPDELELVYSGREDEAQVFFDVYYLKKDIDISTLTLQKEEVDFVEWDTMDDIKELVKNGMFFRNHLEELDRLIGIFNEKGILIS